MDKIIEKRLQAMQEVLFILTERADIQEQEIELLNKTALRFTAVFIFIL